MDVWEYFEQKEREFRELSLVPLTSRSAMFVEYLGSDGRRGHILGELMLTERAKLSVHERIAVVGNHIRRLDYHYYLVIDGEEVWGYDRDPAHTPAEHGHVGPDHVRREARRMTFPEVAEIAWNDVSELEYEPASS